MERNGTPENPLTLRQVAALPYLAGTPAFRSTARARSTTVWGGSRVDLGHRGRIELDGFGLLCIVSNVSDPGPLAQFGRATDS